MIETMNGHGRVPRLLCHALSVLGGTLFATVAIWCVTSADAMAETQQVSAIVAADSSTVDVEMPAALTEVKDSASRTLKDASDALTVTLPEQFSGQAPELAGFITPDKLNLALFADSLPAVATALQPAVSEVSSAVNSTGRRVNAVESERTTDPELPASGEAPVQVSGPAVEKHVVADHRSESAEAVTADGEQPADFDGHSVPATPACSQCYSGGVPIGQGGTGNGGHCSANGALSKTSYSVSAEPGLTSSIVVSLGDMSYVPDASVRQPGVTPD